MIDDKPKAQVPFWRRYLAEDGAFKAGACPPGEFLSAMRRGLGSEPGSVPGMWACYTTLTDSGAVSKSLLAEHELLCSYGFHQQAQSQPMHRDGVGLGAAMRQLSEPRNSEADGRYSAEAVERRFFQLAESTDIHEIGRHLASIMQMLQVIGQPVDYDRLYFQLRHWDDRQYRTQTQRRWAKDFFKSTANTNEKSKETK